jgi:hypothetical protein
LRTLYYSATVITLTGGDTNAYGEACEPGHGYTEQSGHWNPDHSYWTVYPSREDVTPDLYPDSTTLTPAQWLARRVTARLGDLDHIDGHTFYGARTAISPSRLTGRTADMPGAVCATRTFLGDALAAHRLRTAPADTRTLTAAAHAHGFTDTELAHAARLLGNAGSC